MGQQARLDTCIPLRAPDGSKIRGPTPLRSDSMPDGISGLRGLDLTRVSKANRLYHLTAQLVDLALAKHLPFLVENPLNSLFWATSFWSAVAHRTSYLSFQHCAFGGSRPKWTKVATHPGFACDFESLVHTCPGESQQHVHLPWGFTFRSNRRIFATKDEAAYPRPLAACIARCFCLSALRSGAVPPAESLGDLQLSPQQVLPALRAEWGTQPSRQRSFYV